MFKAVQKFYPYVLAGSAAITGLCFVGSEMNRKRHPLVKYAQEIINENANLTTEIGKSRRMSFLVHEVQNPHDNELGFTYKIIGDRTKAEVTVIGDYLTHAELLAMDAQKKKMRAQVPEGEDPVQALLKHDDLPILCLSRFYLTNKAPRMELQMTNPVEPKERIWRMKELVVQTPSINHKIVAEDEGKAIVDSEYTIRTYADLQSKRQLSQEQLKGKIGQEERVQLRPHAPVSMFRSLILTGAIAASVLGTALIFARRWSPLASQPYIMAMAAARRSKAVQKYLGEAVGSLWIKGFLRPFLGRARFEVHVYGSKGEGTLAVTASKVLFARKNSRQWRIKRLTLVHNGQIINI